MGLAEEFDLPKSLSVVLLIEAHRNVRFLGPAALRSRLQIFLGGNMPLDRDVFLSFPAGALSKILPC